MIIFTLSVSVSRHPFAYCVRTSNRLLQRTSGKSQKTQYQDNLNQIFSLLKQRRILPIWITTTAIVDTIHNNRSKAFYRYYRDIESYNKIAYEACIQNSIPLMDLHGFTWKLGVSQFSDHAHYKEHARALQAAFIAGQLSEIIRKEPKTPYSRKRK